MSTATDELVDIDVNLDDELVCGVPDCEAPATHILVSVPCRCPGKAAGCLEHVKLVERIGRAMIVMRELAGIPPVCTCGVPAVAPYAEAVPI